MSLIIIIATIWGISALISHNKQARLAKEQMRQREAQARLLREQRAQAQAQREETARLIALEKARQAQEKMNEKFEREQARQAEQLAKHDEEIRKLNQTISRLSEKVEDIENRIINLEAVKEMNYKKFLEADHAGDDTNKEKYLRKLIALDNQLSSARDSKKAALDKIENAQRKISA